MKCIRSPGILYFLQTPRYLILTSRSAIDEENTVEFRGERQPRSGAALGSVALCLHGLQTRRQMQMPTWLLRSFCSN